MIKYWLITGDTHGKVCERIANIDQEKYPPNETALIILGDAGINYYLNKTDMINKRNIQNTGYTIYCVRGNHEERPENLPGIFIVYDKTVQGNVYQDIEYPKIRYFMDGGTYTIKNKSVLVIGGAYSVDKYYRIGNLTPKDKDYLNPRKTGWFPDEQLLSWERMDIEKEHNGKHYDFVFTHTCPLSWEPRDLFLPFLDQSTVDTSMEDWLEEFKDKINWGIWCWGHFHADRTCGEGKEMFFTNIETFDNLCARWSARLNEQRQNV